MNSHSPHPSLGAARRPPRHRAPHPLIAKPHRTAEPQRRAARHSRPAHRPGASGRGGRHHRASVVVAGNPATVQLLDSDTILSLPLAQHVTTAMLAPGGIVIAAVFDPSDPSDGLIVAAY